MELVRISRELAREVSALSFGEPVTHVYNPLDYAWEPHRLYLERFGGLGAEILLVGMNPGPFGMAQTGVPFGDVGVVRDWMGVRAAVGRPATEHAKRPVLGFDCPRGEVSGKRLWGWARERYGEPERFFARFFVTNYCPLCFMEAGGRNRTPDKLPAKEREALFAICDRALARVVEALSPRWVLGVGKFAEARAKAALGEGRVSIAGVLHPSPASPAANRGWAGQFEGRLAELGIVGKE